jgi:hypothetical protein
MHKWVQCHCCSLPSVEWCRMVLYCVVVLWMRGTCFGEGPRPLRWGSDGLRPVWPKWAH